MMMHPLLDYQLCRRNPHPEKQEKSEEAKTNNNNNNNYKTSNKNLILKGTRILMLLLRFLI